MKWLKTLQVCVIGSMTLGLVACSSMSKGNNGSDDGVDDGAYSMGAGDQASFGKGPDYQNSTNAPENQTYYFDYDSSHIRAQDQAPVEAQAHYLAKHPRARIVLEGNTDERGSREYNIALGERRAMSVADILKMNGVSEKQIRVVSFGEEKPADPGHSDNAYRLNRRVNLVYEASK